MAAQGSPGNSWAEENVALKNVTRHKTRRYQMNRIVRLYGTSRRRNPSMENDIVLLSRKYQKLVPFRFVLAGLHCSKTAFSKLM